MNMDNVSSRLQRSSVMITWERVPKQESTFVSYTTTTNFLLTGKLIYQIKVASRWTWTELVRYQHWNIKSNYVVYIFPILSDAPKERIQTVVFDLSIWYVFLYFDLFFRFEVVFGCRLFELWGCEDFVFVVVFRLVSYLPLCLVFGWNYAGVSVIHWIFEILFQNL